MSKKKPDQIDFGSDSFLDIIANIVGILIILIVVAGLRVSQAPVRNSESNPVLDQQEIVERVPQEQLSDEITIPELDEELPEPEIVKLPKQVKKELETETVILEPDPELKKKIKQLETHLSQFQVKMKKQKKQFQTASLNSQKLKLNLASLSSDRELSVHSFRKSHNQYRKQKRKLNQSQEKIEKLTEKLAELDDVKAPTKNIKHHFSPISKEVHGEELHFRLANNEIAHIPLEQLLEDLKDQIYKQRNWLVKYNQHRGTVGPIKGFSLAYIVRREKLTVLDELRAGHGSVRIGVKEWILNADDNLKSENAKTALDPGSRFMNSIQSAAHDSTLTFWVYPDSYSIYRKIQTFAHQQHFQVAARPLPFGVPIAGSPSGSKSSGQ
jgi:myosin heavy subunit